MVRHWRRWWFDIGLNREVCLQISNGRMLWFVIVVNGSQSWLKSLQLGSIGEEHIKLHIWSLIYHPNDDFYPETKIFATFGEYFFFFGISKIIISAKYFPTPWTSFFHFSSQSGREVKFIKSVIVFVFSGFEASSFCHLSRGSIVLSNPHWALSHSYLEFYNHILIIKRGEIVICVFEIKIFWIFIFWRLIIYGWRLMWH